MKRILLLLIASLWTTGMASLAQSPPAVKGHDAFIDGLREIEGNASQKGFGGKSASKPRTLSPVVSRFNGWFFDVTEKA